MKITEKDKKQSEVEAKLDNAPMYKTFSVVSERVWIPGDGDTYLVVGETQVMEHQGFKKGDWVEIIIKKVNKEDV